MINNSEKNSKGNIKTTTTNVILNNHSYLKDNKHIAGKKIENIVHISRNSKQQSKKQILIEQLKQNVNDIQQLPRGENIKIKKLDNNENNKNKSKIKSVKESRNSNQYGLITFSTNKLRAKNLSKQLRDILIKPKKNQENLNPTPVKFFVSKQEKFKNQSNQKIKKRRAISNQKVKLKKNPFSISVQNLRRVKHLFDNTPSRSSKQKSNSKNSSHNKKSKLIAYDKDNETRRIELGLQFLNRMNEPEIKNVLKKSRRKSTQRLAPKKIESHKFNQQQTLEIRAYMAEKKRRIEKQKQKKEDYEKLKQRKLKQQLMKIQTQRKQNIKTIIPKKKPEKKRSRSKSTRNAIIINKNYQKEYQLLKQQAMKLLNLSTEKKKNTNHDTEKKDSKKKKKNLFTNDLLEKYYNESITKKQYQLLINAAIKIQKVWRGYRTRKQIFMNQQSIKQKQLWRNNNNSIVHIQNQIQHSQSQNQQKIDSEHQQSWQNENIEFGRQEDEEASLSKVMKMIQGLQKSSKEYNLSKQFKYLKQTMIKQEQERLKIQKQNEYLKQNMKQLIKQDQNYKSKQLKIYNNQNDKKIEQVYLNSDESQKIRIKNPINQESQYVIRIPVKINSQQVKVKQENKDIQSQQKKQRIKQIDSLKKFKQQSDNLIKKNKKNNLFIEINNQNESRIKKQPNPVETVIIKFTSPKYQEPNLIDLLKQKQNILNDKHKKSEEVIKNMYQNKLVSPRSYNFKLNELEKIIEKERKSIQRSLKQAQKITNLIKGMEKDKEQIKGLQKLSKQERWNDAINIIDEFSGIIQNEKTDQKQENLNIIVSKQSKQVKQVQQEKFFNKFQSEENKKDQKQKKQITNTILDKLNSQPDSSIESNANQTKQILKKAEDQIDQMNKQILNLIQQKNKKQIKQPEYDQEKEDKMKDQQQIQKPGFETNLNFVKQYCIGLCQYIRANTQYKQLFKKNILSPITYNLPQFLKCFRFTLNHQYSNHYNSFKKQLLYPYYKYLFPHAQIISSDIFNQFNQAFIKLKRHSENASILTVQLESYHLKSLLAAFNQALDYERPNGIYGKPLPWLSRSKYLKNINSKFENSKVGDEYTQQDQKLDQIFGIAIARVIQWGSCLCGFIPESLQLEKGQIVQIDEQYIKHIKETRMALMLQKNLVQQQQKMLQFTCEETQVKIEIGEKLLNLIISQFGQELKDFSSNQTQSYFQYLD